MSKNFFVYGLFALAFVPSLGNAKDLSFKLDCEYDGVGTERVGAPRYQVVKTAFRTAAGKWDVKYSLKVIPLAPYAQPELFDFVPAGSGDEDYSEYNVVDPSHKLAIQAAYIQNRFEWVGLIDDEGSSSYHCRNQKGR